MKLFEIADEIYKTEITEEDAFDLLSKHCSEALKTYDKPIVRGMTGLPNNFGLIHGAAGHRESANTTNYYTVILDKILPPEGYPKRGASIICANWENRSHAYGYGHNAFAIFPYDGATIGVCPSYDMWNTRITLGDDEKSINVWNREFIKMGIPPDATFDEIVKRLEMIRTSEDNQNFEHHSWLFDMEPGNIKKEMAEAYSKPFMLATTSKQQVYNDGVQRELWIGGKCVAIHMSTYKTLKKRIADL